MLCLLLSFHSTHIYTPSWWSEECMCLYICVYIYTYICSHTHTCLSQTSVQFSLVAQSCLTLCDLMDCSMPGLPVRHQLMSIEWVMPSNHLILCCPLHLLPSVFSSIRVFSNESALRIRRPKYWSFSFSISAFNEHSGLMSFSEHLEVHRSRIAEAWLGEFWALLY